jgi:hypothetical protein
MPRSKITAAELIKTAIANAEQAAAVLRHAAMETDDREDAEELWQRAKQLEKTVEPLEDASGKH